MRIFMPKGVLILLAAVFVFAAGCGNDTEKPGVVARVNGRPIYLAQVQFSHDLSHLDASAGPVPSVERLREDYGAILADLVVQELVAQALERQGLAVTDQEVKEAENSVRADYPDNAFEQTLIEEYIDLAHWREQLKYRLALEKFHKQVLRPQIKLGYQEAESYYKDNIADFYVPARLDILLIRGPSRELVEKASQSLLAEDVNATGIAGKFSGVQARSLKIRQKQLPASWENALRGLMPGEASSVLMSGDGFECLVLVETIPAKVLPPSQAYPLVEKVLLEKKLEAAFDAWLAQEIAASEIKVSHRLISDSPEAGTQAPQQGREEAE